MENYRRKLLRPHMQTLGYKELRDNAVDLFGLLGLRFYNRILASALDYSCIRAAYEGIPRNDARFQELSKKHTDILVDEALYFFSQVDPDEHADTMKFFEQKDLDYIMHMIDSDLKEAKKNRKLLKEK